MKHYKDKDNNLFGFEYGDNIPDGLTEITMNEVNSINEAKKPPLTNIDIQSQRQARYRSESDPLFMEWQYDQDPLKEQAWRDKVAQIKSELPLIGV